jgi:hypothetical protein
VLAGLPVRPRLRQSRRRRLRGTPSPSSGMNRPRNVCGR